ncbi:hypothetical protein [Sulfurospirillum barnesii]|nr:hypothetical protein [Sulfurospirillum barnesii]
MKTSNPITGEKMQTLSKKIVEENVKLVEELIIYTDEKVQEPKKQKLKELLESLKKFLLDKKASSARKAEIILRMPLLQITVRKA